MYFDAGIVIPLVDVDDVVVHAKGLTTLGFVRCSRPATSTSPPFAGPSEPRAKMQ